MVKQEKNINYPKKIIISLFLMFFSFFLFYFFQETARALNPSDYSKSSGDPLAIADWNRLDEDFLAKSGDAMAGDLSVGVIAGLENPTSLLDAVNVDYVNTRVNMAAGGGEVFVNWGRQDCPSDTFLIYRGYAFGARETSHPGSATEVMCLQSETIDSGSAAATQTDEVYPMSLVSNTSNLPSEASFNNNFSGKKVQCAVCYNYLGACYEAWNTDSCASSFTPIYAGWAMGGKTVPQTDASRLLETDVYCVNRDFNNSAPNNTAATFSGYFYGLNIANNSDLPVGSYPIDTFVRCAICCAL